MAVSVDGYFSVTNLAATVWSPISAAVGTWLVVVHAVPSGQFADMGGDPGEDRGGWPAGAWQLLAQADAGPNGPKMRIWATQFTDTVDRQIALISANLIDNHTHLYFISGARVGTDIADVFSVGVASSASAGTAQQVPLYNPDASGLLIGAWLSGSVVNYTSLGGPTARTERDGTASTSRTGEQTLSAAGTGSRTATASAAAQWVAATVAVRQPPGTSVTFPQQPLRMKTELALAANPNLDPAYWAALWTDITADAQPRDGGVQITRGRQDETSTVVPSTMAVTLNNASGRYVRLNPLGPYFGQLNKNMPMRLWVDVGDGWRLRYTGFVSEWSPRSQGGQIDEHMPIQVDGPTRRLSRGKVLNSPVRKAVVTRGAASGYWPLETDAASALPGGIDMRVRGTPTFGSAALPGSAGAMTAPFGSSASAAMAGMSTNGSWQVSFWLDVPEGSSDLSPVACWTTPGSTYGRWFAYANSPSFPHVVTVEVAQHSSATEVFAFGTKDVRGLGPVLVTVRAWTSGSDVGISVFLNGIFEAGNTVTGDVVAPITAAGVNSLNFGTTFTISGQINHLYVSAVDQALSDGDFLNRQAWLLDAGAGHAGERACDRIRRLGDEAGIPVVIAGDDGTSEPLGPQPVDDFIAVLRDCEAADGGVLYERRDGRLAYQARSGRYNAAPVVTLDYSTGDVAPPLEPTDDDQHLRNDFTASREGGGSARVVDQIHVDTVGEYSDSSTVNVADDDQLADQAGWRVHLGTADDLRYPAITPNLLGRPSLIPAWAGLDVGQAAAVNNPGRDLPPGQITVFAEGYTEQIDTVSWTATANCSPGDSWKVIQLDDAVLGRADTDGSQLAASATSTATTLSVATTSGPLWTTDPVDLPVDIEVGGEVMTVLDPTTRITDMFTRSASSSWGTATSGQVWATSGGSAANYSVTGSTGRVSCTDVTTRRFTSLGSGITAATAAVTITVPITAAGDTITGGIVMRYTDDNNHYLLQATFAIDGTITVEIFKRVAGTYTSLASTAGAATYSPGVPVRLRASAVGTILRARVWQADQTEPGGWHATAIDSTYSSGKVGTKTSLGPGNTNTLPVAVDYDDLDMLTPAVTGTSSPQTVKVVRSVNGVVKAHSSGEAVVLAQPPILAQ